MNDDLINEYIQKEEDFISQIKNDIGYYFFFWPLFLGFTALVLVATFFYLRYEDRVYEANAQIQIRKENSDASSFLTGGVDGLFSFDNVNVENDISVMTSQHILSQVVQRLNLQTKTYKYGNIVGSLRSYLLFESLPHIELEFKNTSKNIELEFEVEDDMLTINKDESIYTLKKGEVLDKKDFFIRPKDSLFLKDQSFKITHTSVKSAVAEIRSNLTVLAVSSQGEIVDLTIKGTNSRRNEAILNTLIQVLAEDQVLDKREISEVSIDFIEERLKGLIKSIDTISQNTISYQMDNDIYQPAIQTENALSNIIEDQKVAFDLGIQLEVAKALLEKLEEQSNFDILPANIGIENLAINELVNSYNVIVSQRNNLLTSATEQSPLVLQLSKQLQNSKVAIIKGVNRYIEGLNVSLTRYQEMESKTREQVAKFPKKENTLRSYARNFKIVEELYVFLLKRKEEASISYISALPNIKILSYGVSNTSPISPNVQFTYIVAILFGLFIPFAVLSLIKYLDTKINTREDLEKGLKGINILGEVPFDEKLDQSDINSRGIIAESVRVLRSSLSFLLTKQTGNVVTVTSSIKGEGKSFISYQLALSYSALGKKTILLGGDLRNPQLHKYSGIDRSSLGISTFLADKSYENLDKLITKDSGPNGVDYMLSGPIPPNPSELLMRPRMNDLIKLLKKKYDIILVDSAPLMLVSDTSSLLPLSDLVVYVSRSQYSDKNIFPFIKNLNKKANIPPFGMVLNGLITGPNSGYNYKYSYRYSYSYKYNYGYGYGYKSNDEKS
ncbi:MAG: hypothetical protein CL748_05040 [Chloroflexi bacterium]|nr:hypothetical protein [Chloroflexota bacterium]